MSLSPIFYAFLTKNKFLIVTLFAGALMGAVASLGWGLRARMEAGRLRRVDRARDLNAAVQEH